MLTMGVRRTRIEGVKMGQLQALRSEGGVSVLRALSGRVRSEGGVSVLRALAGRVRSEGGVSDLQALTGRMKSERRVSHWAPMGREESERERDLFLLCHAPLHPIHLFPFRCR